MWHAFLIAAIVLLVFGGCAIANYCRRIYKEAKKEAAEDNSVHAGDDTSQSKLEASSHDYNQGAAMVYGGQQQMAMMQQHQQN